MQWCQGARLAAQQVIVLQRANWTEIVAKILPACHPFADELLPLGKLFRRKPSRDFIPSDLHIPCIIRIPASVLNGQSVPHVSAH